MFTFIFPWGFRGQHVLTVFSYTYRRRKSGGRFILTPGKGCMMNDLTVEEVGQLMGGN